MLKYWEGHACIILTEDVTDTTEVSKIHRIGDAVQYCCVGILAKRHFTIYVNILIIVEGRGVLKIFKNCLRAVTL